MPSSRGGFVPPVCPGLGLSNTTSEKNLPRDLGLLYMSLGSDKELKEQIVAATLDPTAA